MDVLITAGSRRRPGFTLVELITALAISVIFLTVGVPALRIMALRNVQSSEINHLLSQLHTARSTSITRGMPAILCPSNDGIDCLEEPHWQDGVMLYLDANNNQQRDDGEERVRYSQTSRQIELEIHSTAGRKQIIYRPDGRSAGSNLTLTFCDPEARIAPRAVILSNAGRPRISDTRPDGSPLTCT